MDDAEYAAARRAEGVRGNEPDDIRFIHCIRCGADSTQGLCEACRPSLDSRRLLTHGTREDASRREPDDLTRRDIRRLFRISVTGCSCADCLARRTRPLRLSFGQR